MRLWCSGSTADFAAMFIRRKAWVRIPPTSLVRRAARWSEQRPYKTKVEGSIPSTPTGRQNTNGIVADKVMHRSLKPADVGSIPTDPTDKKATDLRLQAKGEFLKPLVLSLKPNTDL